MQLYGEPVPYRVVAFTNCLGCDRWCVLGERTVQIVESGQAKGICLSCATGVLRPEDWTGEVIDP